MKIDVAFFQDKFVGDDDETAVSSLLRAPLSASPSSSGASSSLLEEANLLNPEVILDQYSFSAHMALHFLV